MAIRQIGRNVVSITYRSCCHRSMHFSDAQIVGADAFSNGRERQSFPISPTLAAIIPCRCHTRYFSFSLSLTTLLAVFIRRQSLFQKHAFFRQPVSRFAGTDSTVLMARLSSASEFNLRYFGSSQINSLGWRIKMEIFTCINRMKSRMENSIICKQQ